MKDIRELAKARRAEFDALKEKSVKADDLIVALEKAKDKLPVEAKAALAEYAKVKPKKK